MIEQLPSFFSTTLSAISTTLKISDLVKNLNSKEGEKKYFKKALQNTAKRLDEKYENQLFGGNTVLFLINNIEEVISHFEPYGHLKSFKNQISEELDFETLPKDFFDSLKNILLEELTKYHSLKPILVNYLNAYQTDQTFVNSQRLPDINSKLDQVLRLLSETKPTPSKTNYDFKYRYFISRKLFPAQSKSPQSIKELSLLELIESGDENRIVVLGFAGSGKSIELEKVKCELSSPDSVYFPLKIDLGNNDLSAGGIQGFLTKKYPGWDSLNKELVVLIDGLDEANENFSDEIRKQIFDLGQEKNEAIIIVACRNNSYIIEDDERNGLLKGFKSYYLPPFTELEVYLYVSQRIDAIEKINSFLKQLDQVGFREDKFTPFYLVNLVDCYLEKENFFPTSKEELYEFLIEKRKRVEKSKSNFRNKQVSHFETELDKAIEKVAFIFQCTDNNFLVNKDFLKIVPNSNIIDIIQNCYVLDHGGEQKWRFEHNNFKEYLSAKFLATKEFAFIKGILFVNRINKINPRWLNTLGFLMSILSKDSDTCSYLTDFLKSHDPESLIRIEKDKLDLPIREELFVELFTKYVQKGTYPKSPKFSTEDLAHFVFDSEKICEFLLAKIHPENSKLEIDLGLYLLVRNKFWKSRKRKIKQQILAILYDNLASPIKKMSCLDALSWYDIISKDLIDDFLEKLDINNPEIEEGLYYYVKKSEFLEDYFPFVWQCYSKLNSHWGDFKYSILIKLKQVESHIHILKDYRERDINHKYNHFEIIKHLIDQVVEKGFQSETLDQEVFHILKEKLMYSFRDSDFVDVFVKYYTQRNLKNKYVQILLDQYFDGNDEDSLLGIAFLLDHGIVDILLARIEKSNKSIPQLKTTRNLLRWSRNKTAFEYFYKRINELTENKLIWEINQNYSDKLKFQEQIKFLSNKRKFLKSSLFFFKEPNGQLVTWDSIYDNVDHKLWHDANYMSLRELVMYFSNDFPLSRKEFLGRIKEKEDWEYFKMRNLWEVINQGYLDLLRKSEISFLKKWSQDQLTSQNIGRTFFRDDLGTWNCSNSGLYAGFFCHFFKLKLEKGSFLELIRIDCEDIPYIKDKNPDEIDLYEKPLQDSPMLNYVIDELGEKIVKNEIIKNLEGEELYEKVIHYHQRFLRIRNCVEHNELFLKGDMIFFKTKALVWYTELNGDLNEIMVELKNIDRFEKWLIVETVIKRNKNILVSYILELLEKTNNKDDQATIITYLLKCEDPIGLEKMQDWILKYKCFPNYSWTDSILNTKSNKKLEILKEIYEDSLVHNYGSDRSFNDRRRYLDVIVEIGKKNQKNFNEVHTYFNYLTQEYPNIIDLHDIMSQFEFDYYKGTPQLMTIDSALELM